MRKSKYNFYYKLDEKNYLLFNSLSNGLAKVSKEVVDILRKNNKNIDKINGSIKSNLIKGKFIIEENFDELAYLSIVKRKIQMDTSQLSLVIAPTLNCNLDCIYCYENNIELDMDINIEEELIKFIDNRISNNVKSLFITWYGGEPLLCLDKIKRLSKKIINLCKEKNIYFNANMFTNGTNYTKENAMMLKDLGVQFVQITLDGNSQTHNHRRPFKDGSGSFDIIFNNIKNTIGIIPIHLRVNLDKNNMENVLSFCNNLRNEKWFDSKSIYIYYGFVRDLSSSCLSYKEECLSPWDYHKKQLELRKKLYTNSVGIEEHYPVQKFGCSATAINSFVIGPRGELYKCLSNIGDSEFEIGNIFNSFEMNSTHLSYLYESFESDEECKKCKVLPLCMGGCVDMRIKSKKGEAKEKDCTGWKYYLEESLKLYYLNKIEEQNNNENIILPTE